MEVFVALIGFLNTILPVSCVDGIPKALPYGFLTWKEFFMPKIKTRRSAAKRFELTGSGKYRRRRQNMRHILTKKAPGRKMRLGKVALVDSANMKSVRRQLPNG